MQTSSMSTPTVQNFATEQPSAVAEIEAFFDDRCHLCHTEVNLLRRWDRRSKIKFIDISDPNFRPELYGKTLEEFMAEMHARLPDGRWIKGVEVFRRLYSLVGVGLPVAVSRWPVISQMLEIGYWGFAKVRLRLPRRRCEDGTCQVRG